MEDSHKKREHTFLYYLNMDKKAKIALAVIKKGI